MRIKAGKNCYQSAICLLARRDHSCGELKRKLAQRGYPEREIDAAIDSCRRLEYIDDRRFARCYSGQLQRKGYGRRHIRHMLRSKYVAEQIAIAAIENQCSDEAEETHCRRMLEKKLGPLKTEKLTADKKAKLYRYLLGRGFAPAVIRRVIEELRVDGSTGGDLPEI